ncbi:MAG: preprotein translocase subunit SecE [Acidobacteriota bacterium]|jgi:preprotein translocase subunit SecE
MKWWNKTKTFLQEVRVEIGKCYFPGRKEVVDTTVVVLISSFIFALYLWLSDLVILWATQGIFNLAS